MKLSILICTIPSRRVMFDNLVDLLNKDISKLPPELINEVEIISDATEGMTIGEKRNYLLRKASGDFIVFIDDDDMVSRVYIYNILAKIAENPDVDCIGIQGAITTNGKDMKQWYISKDFGSWYEKDNAYYRTPNHISPVRRDIALKVGFPEIQFGEDAEYSKGILPYLHNEVKIPVNIYHYRFISNK